MRKSYCCVMIVFLCLIRRCCETSFCRSIMTALVESTEKEIKLWNESNIISSEMKSLKMYMPMLWPVHSVKTRLFIITNSTVNWNLYQFLWIHETLSSRSSVLTRSPAFHHQEKVVRNTTAFLLLYAEWSSTSCLYQSEMIQLLLILWNCSLNMLNAVLKLPRASLQTETPISHPNFDVKFVRWRSSNISFLQHITPRLTVKVKL